MTSPTPSLLTADELATYESEGFLGPYPLLDAAEIDAVLHDHRETFRSVPWYKSLHVYDSACYRAAARPEILDRLTPILGPDVLLWATQVMVKPPSQNHRWHVDIETLAWRSVNVWVALKNVTLQSTIQLVPRSHHFGPCPQDLERSEQLDLGDGDAILQAARRFDPDAELVSIDLRPGEFVIFDGLLWHGSENTTDATRSALLTQYSPTDVDTRIPATFEPPIEWKTERPACVVVRGQDQAGRNRLVDPGPMATRSLRDRVRDKVRSPS